MPIPCTVIFNYAGLRIRMCLSPGIAIFNYAGGGDQKASTAATHTTPGTMIIKAGGSRVPLVSDAALGASQPPAGSAHKTVLRDSCWADIAVDAISEEQRTPDE